MTRFTPEVIRPAVTRDAQKARPARRWQVLFVVALASFLGWLDLTVVNIAFPSIEPAFSGASLGAISWVLNAYSVVFAAAGAAASGRVADRHGQRVVAAPAVLLFALGAAWLVATASENPDFVGAWLPGSIVSGVGVGAGLTAFSSAAAASLPAHAFAVGGAINVTARQIGAVLGVAILIAIIGIPASVQGVSLFQRSWLFSIVAATLACLIGLRLGRAGAVSRASGEAPAGALIQGDWA